MSKTDVRAFQIEYESAESTEVASPISTREVIAEANIEESLYGKNKPRRVTIDRKIAYDQDKTMSSE